MASLDSLPGDQRAVLQLVLGRGRSYDEIARLLSINPVAVRERALAALDSMGPQTKVDPEHRGMIADYLLGQLAEPEVAEVRNRLADSPSERAWARVVSSELAPLASAPLPEIPASGDSRGAGPEPADPEPASDPAAALQSPDPAVQDASSPEAEAAAPEGETAAAERPRRGSRRSGEDEAVGAGGAVTQAPRSSRRGGAVLIGVAIVVVAVVLFLVLHGGSSKHPAASASNSASTPAASSSTPSSASASSTTAAKVVSQINLSPTAAGSKAAGIAEVLKEGATDGIAIVAQNIPPNSKSPPNAYAVWLYNSPTDAHILGFVNPAVGSNGRLSTAGGLPTNAAHYKKLIVTVETTASPKTPGQIILQGALTGL